MQKLETVVAVDDKALKADHLVVIAEGSADEVKVARGILDGTSAASIDETHPVGGS